MMMNAHYLCDAHIKSLQKTFKKGLATQHKLFVDKEFSLLSGHHSYIDKWACHILLEQ